MINDILIENPDYALACQITDNEKAADFTSLVEYLCQTHGINHQRFTKINGWGNLLFDIDNELIIKVSAPNWAIQSVREIEALKLLKDQQLTVAVPQLLYHGEINGWVYLITDKLSGTNLHDLWPTLSSENQQQLMAQTGAFAKSLNTIPVESNGSLSVDWPEFIRSQSAAAFDRRKSQGLEGPLLDDINRFINSVGYQAQPGQSRLLHCDLHAGNMLVEQINGQWQLSGVIDFGDAVICSDINYEMVTSMILMGLGDKRLNHAFLTAYGKPVDDIDKFQQALMVLSLIRHSGEMGYVLEQVKGCAQMTNWQSVAKHFFAL